MPENNQILSVEGQLVGMPLAGPESFSQAQLDYLKRALGVDETVLFESANGVQNNITLSENIENFEFIRVEWCPYTEASNWTAPYDVVITKVNGGLLHLCGAGMSNNATYQVQTNLLLACSTTSVTVSLCGTITTSQSDSHTSSLTGYKIFKIVGIHRISGGN